MYIKLVSVAFTLFFFLIQNASANHCQPGLQKYYEAASKAEKLLAEARTTGRKDLCALSKRFAARIAAMKAYSRQRSCWHDNNPNYSSYESMVQENRASAAKINDMAERDCAAAPNRQDENTYDLTYRGKRAPITKCDNSGCWIEYSKTPQNKGGAESDTSVRDELRRKLGDRKDKDILKDVETLRNGNVNPAAARQALKDKGYSAARINSAMQGYK